MFDLKGNIVYNYGMNMEEMQEIDLRQWVKKIRKAGKEEDFFRDFDIFVITVFRIIMLFFGVRIGEEKTQKSSDGLRLEKNERNVVATKTICYPSMDLSAFNSRYWCHS